jgi:chromosome segregation ATPase
MSGNNIIGESFPVIPRDKNEETILRNSQNYIQQNYSSEKVTELREKRQELSFEMQDLWNTPGGSTSEAYFELQRKQNKLQSEINAELQEKIQELTAHEILDYRASKGSGGSSKKLTGELAVRIETLEYTAEEASEAAKEAQSAAEQAQGIADEAQGTAEEAQGMAEEVQASVEELTSRIEELAGQIAELETRLDGIE